MSQVTLVTADGLPVLNPRDLIDGLVSLIREVDPNAEFVVMVTDPRDHRAMSLRTCIEEPTTGVFLRSLMVSLFPPEDEDYEPQNKEPEDD